MKKPRLTLTDAEMRRYFGDPMPHVNEDGSVDLLWETLILATARLPEPLPLSWRKDLKVTRFRCHRLLVLNFERALKEIHRDPEVWATVNDFGGCYNWRSNRRARKILSKHSWGAAIDLDVCDNPQGRVPKVHPLVVTAFENEGFVWGGRFKGKSKDGMHFEFVDVGRIS